MRLFAGTVPIVGLFSLVFCVGLGCETDQIGSSSFSVPESRSSNNQASDVTEAEENSVNFSDTASSDAEE